MTTEVILKLFIYKWDNRYSAYPQEPEVKYLQWAENGRFAKGQYLWTSGLSDKYKIHEINFHKEGVNLFLEPVE